MKKHLSPILALLTLASALSACAHPSPDVTEDPSAVVSTLKSIEESNTAKAEEFFKVFFDK